MYCESVQIVRGKCGVGSVSRMRATACQGEAVSFQRPYSRRKVGQEELLLTYISALLLV